MIGAESTTESRPTAMDMSSHMESVQEMIRDSDYLRHIDSTRNGAVNGSPPDRNGSLGESFQATVHRDRGCAEQVGDVLRVHV